MLYLGGLLMHLNLTRIQRLNYSLSLELYWQLPMRRENRATEMYLTLLYKEDVVYAESASRSFSSQAAVIMELLMFTFVTWALKVVSSLLIYMKSIVWKCCKKIKKQKTVIYFDTKLSKAKKSYWSKVSYWSSLRHMTCEVRCHLWRYKLSFSELSPYSFLCSSGLSKAYWDSSYIHNHLSSWSDFWSMTRMNNLFWTPGFCGSTHTLYQLRCNEKVEEQKG